MTISQMIDNLLKKQKMSRRQAAIKAGIPPSSFQSAMQRDGNMSFDMLQRIADVLDVRISDITGESSEHLKRTESENAAVIEARKNAGFNLRRLREEMNMNQEAFANMLGISSSVLSKYENGLRSPDTGIINILKKKTGCSADYLLGLSSVMQEDSLDLQSVFGFNGTETEELIKICKNPLFRYFLKYKSLSHIFTRVDERSFQAAVDLNDRDALIWDCVSELKRPIERMIDDTIEKILEDPNAADILEEIHDQRHEFWSMRDAYIKASKKNDSDDTHKF